MHVQAFRRGVVRWLVVVGASCIAAGSAVCAAEDGPVTLTPAEDANVPQRFSLLTPMAAEPVPAPVNPAPMDSAPAEQNTATTDAAVQAAPQQDPQPSPADLPAEEEGLADKTVVQPVSFKDVTPGSSTIDDVVEAWGDPEQISEEGGTARMSYKMELFQHVVVTVVEDVVTTITIDLDGRFDARRVARHLGVYGLQPAVVPDESGRPLGFAFPERGVLLNFGEARSPGSVSQVLLESVTAESFLLRAEQNLPNDYSACVADLSHALRLEPENKLAHWLRAKVLIEAGEYQKALEACTQFVDRQTKEPEYLLTAGLALAKDGRFDQAAAATKRALRYAKDKPEIKARALIQLGDTLAAGPERDYAGAMKHHLDAVKAGKTIAKDGTGPTRVAGLEILLDANLRVANDIARGPFNRQNEVVPKWLSSARKAAERLIQEEKGSIEYRFRVARHALSAYAALGNEGADVEYWAEEALASGRMLLDETDDSLRRNKLEWMLGLALYDALQFFHQTKQPEAALKYGELATTYLESSKEQMSQVHSQAYLMGRMYFRVGSIHAMTHRDHDEALIWYEKALPMLATPVEQSAYADVGTQGETLVSMAISYWSTDHREEALNMTLKGARMMKQAVRDGILEEVALNVPFSNLATMHRKLGNQDKAEEFAELAEHVKRRATWR